ncbi:hypothetical protein F5J12DRAFT_523718 [Pisolithus orientalis]|uniref:uncharacterized protein n=1 Tax=Pisolithus orientalis TaxID=936130 RepID=UPI00222560FE|nr:uncharacterized protein F5J12DRAFT_523718 [Pisolithus orientalis]KAI6015266.1 hypothetical protein F5J12DRAFT_523718 [Pisolithus orientalis]
MSSGISKIAAERNRRVLMELVSKPGNDVCADCKARAPRWASFNIGIFICVNCASIHRKIGTHITKVKSLTLDEWSKEQVEFMKQNGNIKSNQLYCPDEVRHPPPANLIGTERDSELEKFIRAKYEFKRFMSRKSPMAAPRNAVIPPPRAASASTQHTRARPMSLSGEAPVVRKGSPVPPPPPEKTPENMPSRIFSFAAGSSASPSLSSATIPTRSPTFPQHTAPPTRAVSQPLPSSANALLGTKPTVPNKGEVWDELISLQDSAQNSSLPLQYQSLSHSPSAPLSSLPTAASSMIMSPTGVPQSRTFPTLDMPPNPFVNMNVTGVGVTAGNPFNTTAMAAAAPLGTPSINFPTMNTNTNPFTGASLFTPTSLPASPIFPLTNGAACTPSPNPFPLGYGSVGGVGTGPIGTGMTNPQQSFGTSLFMGPLTPSLVPNPTGLLAPQPQAPTPSTVPFSGGSISAPHTPSPYSTPFATSGALPQQHQPFGTSSTPFLQSQMQFQSPMHPQAQQQVFGHGGLFGGWQG